jgi:hypothetical protein
MLDWVGKGREKGMVLRLTGERHGFEGEREGHATQFEGKVG